MDFILCRLHTAIANLEHVWIVPVTRASEIFEAILREADQRHTIPVVLNIIGRTPEIPARSRSPLPDCIQSILTVAIHHWPTCIEDGTMHLLVGRTLHDSRLVEIIACFTFDSVSEAALVVLQIIDTPSCIRLGVLLFVS